MFNIISDGKALKMNSKRGIIVQGTCVDIGGISYVIKDVKLVTVVDPDSSRLEYTIKFRIEEEEIDDSEI